MRHARGWVMTMRERDVERHLKERVEAAGGIVRKIRYLGRDGCPDRLVGFPYDALGKEWKMQVDHYDADTKFLVELKRPKGRAEAHQAREHERLRAVGFDVRVLDTIEAVDDFLKEVVG
jgi:hypothetical protein